MKREVKANPVPHGMFKLTLADIEQQKKERRQKTIEAVKAEYESNPKKVFELATMQRPTIEKVAQAHEQNEKRIEASLQFSGIKAKPKPDFSKKEAPVKLTVAALKREKHLIDKETAEEMKKLEEMSRGLKDGGEFYRWRLEMEQKDDIERLEHIQKKKIEMEMAREEAILAQQRKEQENHALVMKMKIESEKRGEEREKNIQEDYEKRKALIEEVHSGQDKAR